MLASLLAAYAGIDERALKLGIVFRYWAKVYCTCNHTHAVTTPIQ